MKQEWLNYALQLAKQPADLYSGCRKILRNVQLKFPFENDLTLNDAGYSSAKMRQLERNYLHLASVEAASALWEEYRAKPKYRSVAISCFNTLVKDHKGPRGSKMGSCLLAVTITMLNRQRAVINAHYRTTEFLKKWPADMVFLHERILPHFNFNGMTVEGITIFYDNVTIHPLYFTTIIPALEDPIRELEEINKVDSYFHGWIVKWVSRMLIDSQSRGLDKFSQGLRVRMDAQKRISKSMQRRLVPYLKKHHPGFSRTAYDEAEDWLEEE